MPDALDQTRFSPPDFPRGEEQRLANREWRIVNQDLKVARLLQNWLSDWTDSDRLLLASRLLVEMVEPREPAEDTNAWRIWKAYNLLDDAARAERDRDIFAEEDR